MADQVQATLDRMVPALRDLLDRGIFTEVRSAYNLYLYLFNVAFVLRTCVISKVVYEIPFEQ